MLHLPAKRREQAEVVQYARPQFFDDTTLQVDGLLERSFHSIEAIQSILTERGFDAARKAAETL